MLEMPKRSITEHCYLPNDKTLHQLGTKFLLNQGIATNKCRKINCFLHQSTVFIDERTTTEWTTKSNKTTYS